MITVSKAEVFWGFMVIIFGLLFVYAARNDEHVNAYMNAFTVGVSLVMWSMALAERWDGEK